jgi:predicted nucleic acid-binding protein
MNIVIDSNILFSALIKDSETRKMILNYDGFFLFPSYILIEMEHHKDELLKKSKISKSDFDKLLHLLMRKVMVVPSDVMKPYKTDAIKIVTDIDINDAIFIACALAYKNSILWSNDKKLKTQHVVKVLNTQEIQSVLRY